jgi:hypothetical protein
MAEVINDAQATADDDLLTSSQVRQQFGGICEMTLHRWERDPRLNFPPPLIINRRKYHRRSKIQQFKREREQAEGVAT